MQPGANPFYFEGNKKHREKLLKIGSCDEIWKLKSYDGYELDDPHKFHKCRRLKNHTSKHLCNCGATTSKLKKESKKNGTSL